MAFFGSGANVDYLIQQYIKNNGLLKILQFQKSDLNGQSSVSFSVPKRPSYICVSNYADGDYWRTDGFGDMGGVHAVGYYEQQRWGTTDDFVFSYSGTTLTMRHYSGTGLNGNLRVWVFYTP